MYGNMVWNAAPRSGLAWKNSLDVGAGVIGTSTSTLLWYSDYDKNGREYMQMRITVVLLASFCSTIAM
jgi:dUTPase